MAIGVLHFVYAFRGGGVTAVPWEILLAMVCAVAGFYILANTSVGSPKSLGAELSNVARFGTVNSSTTV
jgi:predicted ABC-type sugar transport system permease subunit